VPVRHALKIPSPNAFTSPPDHGYVEGRAVLMYPLKTRLVTALAP